MCKTRSMRHLVELRRSQSSDGADARRRKPRLRSPRLAFSFNLQIVPPVSAGGILGKQYPAVFAVTKSRYFFTGSQAVSSRLFSKGDLGTFPAVLFKPNHDVFLTKRVFVLRQESRSINKREALTYLWFCRDVLAFILPTVLSLRFKGLVH